MCSPELIATFQAGADRARTQGGPAQQRTGFGGLVNQFVKQGRPATPGPDLQRGGFGGVLQEIARRQPSTSQTQPAGQLASAFQPAAQLSPIGGSIQGALGDGGDGLIFNRNKRPSGGGVTIV